MYTQKRIVALQKFDGLQLPKVEAKCLHSLIETIFDPSTKSHERRIDVLSRLAPGITNHLQGTDAHADAKALCDLLKEHLFSLGYLPLSDILTPREHLLSGSSSRHPDLDVPVGLQSGLFSLDRVAAARQLTSFFTANLFRFDVSRHSTGDLLPFVVGPPADPIMFSTVNVSLEHLNKEGRVTSPPRLVRPIEGFEFLHLPLNPALAMPSSLQ